MEKQAGFKNYVWVDPNPKKENKEASEFEKSLIEKYLKNIILLENLQIKVINENFFYTSYSITSKNKKYLLKVSTDPENKKLQTEKKALKTVNSLVRSELINYELNDEYGIEFLLTSWENGENMENIGIDGFIYNLGTFSAVLDTVHESSTLKIPSFKDKFEENNSICDAKDLIDPQELILFEKLTGLSIDGFKKLLNLIKEKFYTNYKEGISVFCHSNLKFSNILYQSEYIKFINFEHSHVSDIYYSLLKCINNTGLYYSEKKVRSFLSLYHKHSEIVKHLDLQDFLQAFESKKEINRIFVFQDLLCKTLFHFFSYGAFSKKKSLNHFMYVYLNIKPTIEKFFPEYIESLDRLFFTPMQTVKTYNIEELKSAQSDYINTSIM